MRLRVDLIPKLPRDDNDYVGAYAPWFWYGLRPVMGDRLTWADAPLGSKYWRVAAGSVTEWLKVADNKVQADWQAAGAGVDLTGYLAKADGWSGTFTTPTGDTVVVVNGQVVAVAGDYLYWDAGYWQAGYWPAGYWPST